MAIEVKDKRNFPEPGDIFHFVQIYTGKQGEERTSFFYDEDGVPTKHIIEDSLNTLGISFNYEDAGTARRPALVGLDYRVVGMGRAGITQARDKLPSKFIWGRIENNEYGSIGINIYHFEKLEKQLGIEFNLKHSTPSQGEKQDGR